MQLRLIAGAAQLSGDKIAGAMDVGAVPVHIEVEPVVDGRVDPAHLAQMDGGGDIFRLHMESRRVGLSHLPGHPDGRMGQGEGREKVDNFRPLDCLPDDGLVHLGKGHALGTN